jgi:hypothetical protein
MENGFRPKDKQRPRWQAATLLLTIASPFGMYVGLQSGMVWLWVACLAVFSLAIALTAWLG